MYHLPIIVALEVVVRMLLKMDKVSEMIILHQGCARFMMQNNEMHQQVFAAITYYEMRVPSLIVYCVN
jgi:TfoX/Sxy family transcriptional regulator of competence genes